MGAGKKREGSSKLAFAAAAMFCLAGAGELFLGFTSRHAFGVLGTIFLVAGVLWIGVGMKFKREERAETGERL